MSILQSDSDVCYQMIESMQIEVTEDTRRHHLGKFGTYPGRRDADVLKGLGPPLASQNQPLNSHMLHEQAAFAGVRPVCTSILPEDGTDFKASDIQDWLMP